jgi:hypothetical protein
MIMIYTICTIEFMSFVFCFPNKKLIWLPGYVISATTRKNIVFCGTCFYVPLFNWSQRLRQSSFYQEVLFPIFQTELFIIKHDLGYGGGGSLKI